MSWLNLFDSKPSSTYSNFKIIEGVLIDVVELFAQTQGVVGHGCDMIEIFHIARRFGQPCNKRKHWKDQKKNHFQSTWTSPKGKYTHHTNHDINLTLVEANDCVFI